MPEDVVTGPSEGPNGEEAVVLRWNGDHSACGRFFMVEQLKPVREFPVELFGRPGWGQPSVKLDSPNPCGGYKDRAEARQWAGCVAYQLEHGDQDEA